MELVENDEIPEISQNTEISEMSTIVDIPINECTICLDSTGELIKYEHCMPVYVHNRCIEKWYSNRYNRCIICNNKIVKDGQCEVNKINETLILRQNNNLINSNSAKNAICAIAALGIAAICSTIAVLIYTENT